MFAIDFKPKEYIKYGLFLVQRKNSVKAQKRILFSKEGRNLINFLYLFLPVLYAYSLCMNW